MCIEETSIPYRKLIKEILIDKLLISSDKDFPKEIDLSIIFL
jgi:hypothetical protein